MRAPETDRELRDLIEKHVSERRTLQARAAIQAWVKRLHSSDDPRLFEACEWYRRLGLYAEGLALLKIQEGSIRPATTETGYGLKLLWFARLLNLLGASAIALTIIGKLKVVSAQEHRIVANIHLANFEYERALEHFAAMEQKERDPASYLHRLGLLGLCDCLSGVGRADEAFEKARVIPASESIFEAIRLQALGEYRARSGRMKDAIEYLERSASLFPAEEETSDRAILFKWQGYVRAKQGDRDSARKFFASGARILLKPGMRADALLDLLRLKSDVGLASRLEEMRLLHYPGKAAYFQKLLEPLREKLDEGWAFTSATSTQKPAIETLPAANEFRSGKSRYLGIPNELRLASWLGVVGEWGLSSVRCKSLLWGSEPFSFLSFDDRLSQLLRRLRTEYELDGVIRSQRVILAEPSRRRLAVHMGGGADLPSLLREKKGPFPAAALSEHYEIGVTQRLNYLAQWSERGWIRSTGKARARRYEVSPDLMASITSRGSRK